MKLYAALYECGRLEIDFKHPVGLISHVIEVDEEDRRYSLLYRAMTDRELRWTLSDMLGELFTAGKIAATSLVR
jgi:hypothetical protein